LEQIMQILQPIQVGLEHVIVFFYNLIPNYGIAIILLTIAVRIILTPLTLSQTRSMAKMQKMQPELKEIQKRYKDDKVRMQQETMEFYKKNNVNPLAGCLPLLLQMPVFFALFRVLREPTERVTDLIAGNYGFLWLNLQERDPYFILVILMVATMFVSMKMTTTDPKQSMVMFLMPIIFGFISYRFEAGILLYWVTTNVWSIGQQWVVNKFVKKGSTKQEIKRSIEEKEKTITLETKKTTPKKRGKRKKK
jgi:YidC/Oxa1 family membrane protein insertase